jgi:hypothetical protein
VLLVSLPVVAAEAAQVIVPPRVRGSRAAARNKANIFSGKEWHEKRKR